MKESLKTKQGFTLLEVLLVVAIIGIVSVAGGVYVGGVVSNTTLEEIASIVISDIKNAQVRAMNGVNGYKWGVCFRNSADDNRDYYELVSLSSGGSDACSGVTVNSTFFLQEGVTYSSPTNGNPRSLIFNKITGETTSSNNIEIELTLRNEIREIIITPTGRIY